MNKIGWNGPTRRQGLLGTLGLGLAATPLAAPFIGGAAAAEPIRIGLVLAKQGAMVQQTEYIAQGTYLALQQNPTVLGRTVELTWLDEPDPQAAQQNMQKLIEEQKVVAVLGGGLSANALAMSAAANRAKIPYIANNAAAREITGKDCNRYTFRVQPSVPVQTRAIAPYLSKLGKKWYFLTASYAFGQDILRSFRAVLKEQGGTEVGTDEVPLNTPDYSSFILKIRQAKPDVVVGGLAASDISTFLKQWNELGMRGRIPFAEIAIGDTDIWSVGPAASGVYSKPWYFNDPNNSPADRAFTEAYRAKHSRPPADKAWMGWLAMRSLLESIELAGSTAQEAIVDGLERWRAMDGDLPIYYRNWDHQMLHRTLVVEVRPKIADQWDYFEVRESFPRDQPALEAAFGAPEEIGCRMGAL